MRFEKAVETKLGSNPNDSSEDFRRWFAETSPYSYFCNAEERDSIIANESGKDSSLSSSCFLSLEQLNSN